MMMMLMLLLLLLLEVGVIICPTAAMAIMAPEAATGAAAPNGA